VKEEGPVFMLEFQGTTLAVSKLLIWPWFKDKLVYSFACWEDFVVVV